ncbi:glycosyltransferase family 2 protein [Paenibacillus aestuarii]|uniref:Glycosyltransferase family 2 protein n=1 Tax=Paenibacillus aestuarii TaxID=516965 RepID=A0ABW0K3J4_9BACL|nr:glycosyltransferase family A protein [Paenibacillus aestuarii]
MSKLHTQGVTVITVTMRFSYIDKVFENYASQNWRDKELMIILNNDAMNLAAYQQRASQYPNVRIYQLPEHKTLGQCLNFAVTRAKYDYLAKFDDDDYYGPKYLTEAMRLFRRTKADVVGKKSYFLYFPHRKTLLLRRPSASSYTRCKRIAGATIMFHRRVFKRVRFVRVKRGSDARFLQACLRKGFKLYCTSSYNFAAFRRIDRSSHTWQISEKELFAEKSSKRIRTTNFKRYVNRPVRAIQKL